MIIELNFDDKPQLLLNESNHNYYYIKNNEKVWLNNFQSISCLVNEWMYIKSNYNEEKIPYHWKKEFLYLHSENDFMAMGTKIHNQIATNTIDKEFKWIKKELPQKINGKFEFGMFTEDTKVSLVGSCDLINLENGEVVIYEFKNSFNPLMEKELIEKAKLQLFLYGYLAFQTFYELKKEHKIKLVLLVFEHFNKNTLRYEYKFNLTDIIRETKFLNSVWLNKRDELHQKKIEYRKNFSIEEIETPLSKYYALKNDMDFINKKKLEKDLEVKIKTIIDTYRQENPDQKFFSTVINDKIVGYYCLNTQQLDKDKYIKELEETIEGCYKGIYYFEPSYENYINYLNGLKKDCVKNVNRKYWKESK